MPSADEPAARMLDLTVADVAEALEAPLRLQLRQRIDKDLMAVYSVTAERRAIVLMLVRPDDSFVWRVVSARPMGTQEFETWLGRTSDD